MGTWRDTLSQQMKEHPGRTVAAALGAGYVVGGGLFSRFTAHVVEIGMRIGLRVGLVPLVAKSVFALGQGVSSRSDARPVARSDRRHSRSRG